MQVNANDFGDEAEQRYQAELPPLASRARTDKGDHARQRQKERREPATVCRFVALQPVLSNAAGPENRVADREQQECVPPRIIRCRTVFFFSLNRLAQSSCALINSLVILAES